MPGADPFRRPMTLALALIRIEALRKNPQTGVIFFTIAADGPSRRFFSGPVPAFVAVGLRYRDGLAVRSHSQ